MAKSYAMQYADKVLKNLDENGAFLITGEGGKNVMTIGWGAMTVIWFKDVFIAPVRKSRHTHSLLEAHKEFTVFVPQDDMKESLSICGSKSGRDTDKFDLCGFRLLPSKTVGTPRIDGKGFVLECRVLYETDVNRDALDPSVADQCYSGADTDNLHTLYFGEITAAYET